MAKSEAGNGKPLYPYDPSLAAAIIFIILYFTSTSVHIFQLVRKRTWYFIPFVIGGIFAFIGYIGRAIAWSQTPDWTLSIYVMQYLLILLAPALFAASIYMVLGRIIRLTGGEKHSLVRTTWLTKVFVASDVLSFLMQCAGGAILASSTDKSHKSNQSTGQDVVVGGLILQVLMFGFFITVAVRFHYKISFNPTAISNSLEVPWKRELHVLYFASCLIMARSIFRVVENIQGNNGELLTHEVYLYIFDALLMFIVMLVFNIWHPSKIISKDILRRSEMDLEALKKEHTVSQIDHTTENA